jgi:hypothetical protein
MPPNSPSRKYIPTIMKLTAISGIRTAREFYRHKRVAEDEQPSPAATYAGFALERRGRILDQAPSAPTRRSLVTVEPSAKVRTCRPPPAEDDVSGQRNSTKCAEDDNK